MTFLVEYEPEEDNDIVEIKILIETEDYSLQEALKKASGLVASVTEAVDSFCNDHADDETDCEQAVDIGDF